MVKSCCVWGCTARQRPGTGLGFFSFPKDNERRQTWVRKLGRLSSARSPSSASACDEKRPVKAVKRLQYGTVVASGLGLGENFWQPGKWDVVCGRHFVTKKPNADEAHPDYVPSLFLRPETSDLGSEKKLDRYNRQKRRHNSSNGSDDRKTSDTGMAPAPDRSSSPPEVSNLTSPLCKPSLPSQPKADECSTCADLKLEVAALKKERDQLRAKLGERKEYKERNINFYTGIPNLATFYWLFHLVSNFITERSAISKKDQILLTLMKIRLGLQNRDLACRFNISATTVSHIINQCIPVMARRLSFLIKWPNKEVLVRNMPKSFKQKFKNCSVIIDCTEFFIDRPYNIRTRAKTWSNYKHHHTLKALIGITPYGSISFMSKLWGGRISDKEITSRSSFYNVIQRGDQVMADRGFTIAQELATRGAYLVMPPFIAGRKQLPGNVVHKARQISRLRIHVERAIERVKNFAILKNTMPLTLVPLADSILTLCGCLTNLQPKLIK